MKNRPLSRILSMLLALCLLLAMAPVVTAEEVPETAAEEDELFAAPVDDAEPEAEADLWTKEIALDVEAAEAAEAENPVADKAAIPVDEDHFPDETFRDYVSTRIDTNGDGALSESERTAITSINVVDKTIKSLEGIKYFPSLKKLECGGDAFWTSPLTSLDVSGCTALEYLFCYNATLTSLNISGCTALTYLCCVYTSLTQLDVSDHTALEDLICYHNKLTSLDVGNHAALETLNCCNNELTSLDVSGCTALGYLRCDGNQLTSVNIGDCPNLVRAVEEGQYSESRYYCSYMLHDWKIGFDPGVEIITTPSPAVEEPALAASKATIGVKQKYQLLAEDSPVPASACRFKSSNRKVATVNKKGIVKGVKPGKATITVTAPSGAKLKCKITVKKAPKKITVRPKQVELDVGRSASLVAKITAGSVTAITWMSSNEAVATVSDSGIVVAVGYGTAIVTATTSNGLSASCTVKVPVPPTKIKITTKTRKIKAGDTLTLKTKLTPRNAETTLKWESDNPEVATVSKKGVVKGVKKGTANITVTTSNGLQATVKITVKKNPVTYRALLVGQVNYVDASRLPACELDAQHMANMFGLVRGAAGGKFAVTTRTDLSYNDFKSAIETTFAEADSNDVSLVFYSGHGAKARGDNEGALCMVPNGYMPLGEFSGLLANIPGKVVVFLDSCFSGTAVYREGEAENGFAANRAATDFDAAVVNAFAGIDPGILEDADGDVVDGGSHVANVGELRVKNKFYVLTAARRKETSLCSDDSSYFTGWLTDGVSLVGDMPADANRDHYVTLDELFQYIKRVSDAFFTDDDTGMRYDDYQHVQVYPKNCNFMLFKR